MLLDDVAGVALGDIVRRPGRKGSMVAFDLVSPPPDRIAVEEHPELGPQLVCEASSEAVARAAHGEGPGLLVQAWCVLDRRWALLAPPLERLTDPLPFVRVQPVSRVTVTLVAWHARVREVEAVRQGWSLENELEAAIREEARAAARAARGR